MQFPSTILRTIDRAAISRWRGLVRRIQKRSKTFQSHSMDRLKRESLALRYEVLSGKSIDSLICEAFALVQEASRRTLQMSHYPVQILGGIAMHFGSIAVMQTGEGKTLTATLPIYLAALTGKGAHLATANDYLARRDAKLMAPIYETLGLSVGVVTSESTRSDRLTAYACDVTYSTAKEIGFDFLRDRLQKRKFENQLGELIPSFFEHHDENQNQTVQREFNFMLVDEADSILIDEAKTPLIVSSVPEDSVRAQIALYQWCSAAVNQFMIDQDFEVDPKTKSVSLKREGRQRVRQLKQPDLMRQLPILDIYEQVELALFVEQNYFRDRQYVVREGEVVIVDEFTGRLAEGRKWRSGIHQAIEARENLEISVETGEAARITVQDLFLRYDRLAGMTGTAANSAAELRKIYDVRVIEVPTNRPPQRTQWPDLVFGSEDEKWAAIVQEVAEVHKTGRPVLIGTRSIDKSELLSRKLAELDIDHDVLNARNLAREADIVKTAGQVSRVTVATNMAGRGTDIKVSNASLDLGGLHVICSEVHESARIDRQLIGRCGRQGDPGTFRQFMSLEDEILSLGLGPDRVSRFEKQKNQSPQILKRYAGLFRAAQRRVESQHFRGRKMLLHREKTRKEMQRQMGQDPYLDTAGV